jgi:predicted HTH domain antitoxin
MQLTVELPNDLAEQADPAHIALEAIAVEGFKTGALTKQQARGLLGLGRIAFEDLLKTKGEFDSFYNVDDLMNDIRTLDDLDATSRERE